MVCEVMVWVIAGDGGDGFNTFLGHILSIRLSFWGHFFLDSRRHAHAMQRHSRC